MSRRSVIVVGCVLFATLWPGPSSAHTAKRIDVDMDIRSYTTSYPNAYHLVWGSLDITNKAAAPRAIRCKLTTPIQSQRYESKVLAKGETDVVPFVMRVRWNRHRPPVIDHCHPIQPVE